MMPLRRIVSLDAATRDRSWEAITASERTRPWGDRPAYESVTFPVFPQGPPPLPAPGRQGPGPPNRELNSESARQGRRNPSRTDVQKSLPLITCPSLLFPTSLKPYSPLPHNMLPPPPP